MDLTEEVSTNSTTRILWNAFGLVNLSDSRNHLFDPLSTFLNDDDPSHNSHDYLLAFYMCPLWKSANWIPSTGAENIKSIFHFECGWFKPGFLLSLIFWIKYFDPRFISETRQKNCRRTLMVIIFLRKEVILWDNGSLGQGQVTFLKRNPPFHYCSV